MGKEIVIVSFGGPFYLKIPQWDYPNNNLFEVSCARPEVLSLRFFYYQFDTRPGMQEETWLFWERSQGSLESHSRLRTATGL